MAVSQKSLIHERPIQWNIVNLIVLTFAVALTLGMPLPVLAFSLQTLLCLFMFALILLLVQLVSPFNQNQANANNFFKTMLLRFNLYSLLGICMCGFVLWIRVSGAEYPAETWQEIMRALQTR